MREITMTHAFFIAAVSIPVLFVLFAPAGWVARATNTVGNFIQKIVSYFKK